MEFKDKTILIVSPQAWGKLFVSKHYYATELAQLNNNVYFLNPPNFNLKTEIEINDITSNLHIIDFNPFFPYKLRFHARTVYDFLMIFQVKRIQKKIAKKIDILWCFDFNLFTDLKIFGADISIYHPVDPVILSVQIIPAKSADVIFSVSEKILSNFDKIKKPKSIINHGINDTFKSLALDRQNRPTYKSDTKIRVGYIGNLTRPIINEPIIQTIISEHPQIEFHFWGPFSSDDNNLGGLQKTSAFIEFLKSQKNTFLRGVKVKEELISEISEIDIFLLVYSEDKGSSDRSNSHKLTEYLATGRVTVANRFSHFSDTRDLIIMPETDNDELIPTLFQKVISNLEHYNSPELQRKRIAYALDNTYEKQIERIEKIISENINKKQIG